MLDTDDAGTWQGSIESAHASLDRAVATVDVTVTTGDRWVSDGKVPSPNVLKKDVEGAAPGVLDGMIETI